MEQIKCAKDYYFISENGDVLNKRKSRYLRPLKTAQGYSRVILGGKNLLVHRLVGIAFLPNPENKPFINHLNGNKRDNRVENLEWCDQKRNMEHSSLLGLSAKGERHGRSKLKKEDIAKIFSLKSEGMKVTDIAKLFGVKHPCISRILNGKRWKHLLFFQKFD